MAVSPKDLLQHLSPGQMELPLENPQKETGNIRDVEDAGSIEDTRSMGDAGSMENIGNVEGGWNTDDRLQILLEILDFLPKSVEEIRTAYEKKTKAAVATPEILCMLMELCMEGTATQVSGNYFAAKVVTVSQQFCK